MSDVVVNKDEWGKLASELNGIHHEDAGKINSFMVKHVNTKWAVCSVCVVAYSLNLY